MGMLDTLYQALFNSQQEDINPHVQRMEMGGPSTFTDAAKALYKRLGITENVSIDAAGNISWSDKGKKKRLSADKVNPVLYQTEESERLKALFRQLYAMKS